MVYGNGEAPGQSNKGVSDERPHENSYNARVLMPTKVDGRAMQRVVNYRIELLMPNFHCFPAKKAV